jgi:hypothetical protein
VHPCDAHDCAETGIFEHRGQEVGRQVANCIGAYDGRGLGTGGVEGSPQLFHVVSAAPRPLIPYAYVVDTDVVERARAGDEICLILHIVI